MVPGEDAVGQRRAPFATQFLSLSLSLLHTRIIDTHIIGVVVVLVAVVVVVLFICVGTFGRVGAEVESSADVASSAETPPPTFLVAEGVVEEEWRA